MNFPDLTGDWFASAVIMAVSTAIAGIILSLAEKRIPGNKAGSFLVVTVVSAFLLVLMWYNVIGILIGSFGFLVEITLDCSVAYPIYRNAVEWNHKFKPSWERYVSCSYVTGETDDALLTLEQYEDSLNTNWEYWRELSWLYFSTDDFVMMNIAVENAVEINATELDWICNLGSNLHKEFHYKEAENILRIVTTRDPGNADASFWLAWSIYEQDRYSEALDHFGECIRLNPSGYNLSRCIAGKGFVFRDIGYISEARSQFETSLQMNPSQDDVRTALDEINQ